LTPGSVSIPIQAHVDYELSVQDFLKQLQCQLEDILPFEQSSLQNIRHLSSVAATACDFQTELIVQIANEEDGALDDVPLEKIDNSKSPRDDTYALWKYGLIEREGRWRWERSQNRLCDAGASIALECERRWRKASAGV
jgi:hypothetical protein